MKVVVSGKHLNIGYSLRTYIESNIEKHVKKYFVNAINTHVVIAKQGHFFDTHILVNQSTGNKVVIKSNSLESDPYVSVDVAMSKIDRQLNRFKKKINNHHKQEGIKYDLLQEAY